MQIPTEAEIMQSVNSELSAEGLQFSEVKNKLSEQIIPALVNSKGIQAALYAYEPPHAKGISRMLKNQILRKARNIIVNVLEKVIMRQQKYNELLFQAVIELQAENEELKQQVAELSHE